MGQYHQLPCRELLYFSMASNWHVVVSRFNTFMQNHIHSQFWIPFRLADMFRTWKRPSTGSQMRVRVSITMRTLSTASGHYSQHPDANAPECRKSPRFIHFTNRQLKAVIQSSRCQQAARIKLIIKRSKLTSVVVISTTRLSGWNRRIIYSPAIPPSWLCISISCSETNFLHLASCKMVWIFLFAFAYFTFWPSFASLPSHPSPANLAGVTLRKE